MRVAHRFGADPVRDTARGRESAGVRRQRSLPRPAPTGFTPRRRGHASPVGTAGCSRAMIRAEVDARRWSVCGAVVIVLHNHPLTRRQRRRVAVLDAGGDAALCSHTALELAGFKAFAQEAAAVHLLVPRDARVWLLSGVVVHESRRIQPEGSRSAGYSADGQRSFGGRGGSVQRWPRFACAMLAAVVQQGTRRSESPPRSCRVGRAARRSAQSSSSSLKAQSRSASSGSSMAVLASAGMLSAVRGRCLSSMTATSLFLR